MKNTLPKHPGGRPTKYDPSFIQIAEQYIDQALPENMDLPSIEGLAEILHVDDERISEWAKLYPEFHATIKRLKLQQKKHLMVTGLYGGKEINPTMAIFLLKVNHGMIETEKRQLEVTGDYNIIDDLSGKRITKATTQSVSQTTDSD